MADFFYWNKDTNNEGFGHLSVYLKNPANNRPGWYFANAATYIASKTERSGPSSPVVSYRKMPVKFGIHHPNAGPDEAHKPTKMGKPRSTGGFQIVTPHEFALRFAENSSNFPGQKAAQSSITIQTGATGTLPTPSPPSMGGGSGGY